MHLFSWMAMVGMVLTGASFAYAQLSDVELVPRWFAVLRVVTLWSVGGALIVPELLVLAGPASVLFGVVSLVVGVVTERARVARLDEHQRVITLRVAALDIAAMNERVERVERMCAEVSDLRGKVVQFTARTPVAGATRRG